MGSIRHSYATYIALKRSNLHIPSAAFHTTLVRLCRVSTKADCSGSARGSSKDSLK